MQEPHETIEDTVESKIFKFKYRQCNDDEAGFQRRQGRVIKRFYERAESRDPKLETDLFQLFQDDMKEQSVAQFMVDPASFKRKAVDETRVFREYMVKESLQQYRDYYETDNEEVGFMQYMEDMTNRDKIRFSENFHDYTQVK